MQSFVKYKVSLADGIFFFFMFWYRVIAWSIVVQTIAIQSVYVAWQIITMIIFLAGKQWWKLAWTVKMST